MARTIRPSLRNYLATVEECIALAASLENAPNNSAATQFIGVTQELQKAAQSVLADFEQRGIANEPEMSEQRVKWDNQQVSDVLLPVLQKLKEPLRLLAIQDPNGAKYTVGSATEQVTALALKNGLDEMLIAEMRYTTRDPGAYRSHPAKGMHTLRLATKQGSSSLSV